MVKPEERYEIHMVDYGNDEIMGYSWEVALSVDRQDVGLMRTEAKRMPPGLVAWVRQFCALWLEATKEQDETRNQD